VSGDYRLGFEKNWPGVEFHMVPDAGHSAKEEGILSELVKACDKFAHLK